ncbi:MAG: DUF1187 family protein [Bacilli bacterium]
MGKAGVCKSQSVKALNFNCDILSSFTL